MRHLKLTIAVSISIALTVAALSALLAARLHFGIRDGCIICKENPHTDSSTLRETNSNVMLMVMITVSTIVAATVMLPENRVLIWVAGCTKCGSQHQLRLLNSNSRT